MISPNINKLLDKIKKENGTAFDLSLFKNDKRRSSVLTSKAVDQKHKEQLDYEFNFENFQNGTESQLMKLIEESQKSGSHSVEKVSKSKKIKKITKKGRSRTKKKKKLKLRRRSDEEYGLVTEGLIECVTLLQNNHKLFKFISNNPFNKLKNNISKLKGYP